MVVDDHPVVCDGVRLLLGREEGFAVVATATTADAAVVEAGRVQPDVVLLDLRLPGSSPPQVVRALRAACPSTRIVLFTAHPDHALLPTTLAEGVDGCLLKDAGMGDLATSLRLVMAGDVVLDPRIGPMAGTRVRRERDQLTRREHDVVELVAQGLTNPEIGERLHLTRNSVRGYLQSAMLKLGAHNRVEVISRAHDAGLV